MIFNKCNLKRLYELGVAAIRNRTRHPLQSTIRFKDCKCCCFPSATPHPPRDPPENYNPCTINTSDFEAPENIQPLVFRPLQKEEVLGPKASKNAKYKNPEYYAYHRFSHVDLFMNAMRIRMEKRMQQMCPKRECPTEKKNKVEKCATEKVVGACKAKEEEAKKKIETKPSEKSKKCKEKCVCDDDKKD